jgi:hypothetical protein
MLTREDVEVHFRALQTIIEQLKLCEWGHCRLEKLHRCSGITSGSWDAAGYPTCPRPCTTISKHHVMMERKKRGGKVPHIFILGLDGG